MKRGDVPYYPSQKYHLSMYVDGKFYSLHIKHDLRNKTGGLERSGSLLPGKKCY